MDLFLYELGIPYLSKRLFDSMRFGMIRVEIDIPKDNNEIYLKRKIIVRVQVPFRPNLLISPLTMRDSLVGLRPRFTYGNWEFETVLLHETTENDYFDVKNWDTLHYKKEKEKTSLFHHRFQINCVFIHSKLYKKLRKYPLSINNYQRKQKNVMRMWHKLSNHVSARDQFINTNRK